MDSYLNMMVTADHPVPIEPMGGTATVTNVSGGVLYWADDPQVSPLHFEGTITVGNSTAFTGPEWIWSASLTSVRVAVSPPLPPDQQYVHQDGTGMPASVLSVGSPAPGAGNTGDWFLVRSDGTIARFTPPSISADAWGAAGNGTAIDSAAMQNAVNAANANGGGTVKLTAGKTYKLGWVQPKSNVTIDGYGATVITDPANTIGPFFMATTDPAISNFEVRGIRFAGTGAETTEQQCVVIRQSTGIKIIDCTVTNWHTGVFYLQNCNQYWVQRNRITGSTVASGYNAINNVYTSTLGNVAPTDFVITHNYVWGCPAVPINIQPGGARGLVSKNIVQITGSAAWGIGLENTGSFVTERMSIVDNHVEGPGTTAIGINVNNGGNSANPLLHTRMQVSNNTIKNVSTGIAFIGSYSQIKHNTIDASSTGINVFMPAQSTPQLIGNQIDDNLIHMAANAAGTGLSVGELAYGSVSNNEITYDTGSSAGGHAMAVVNCGWVKIRGNTLDYAPARGINSTGSNDLQIEGNHILNPNESKANGGGAGWDGIHLATWTGATTIVRDNEITDNRGTHTMQNGIASDIAGLSTMGNRISGSLGTATSNTATVTGV